MIRRSSTPTVPARRPAAIAPVAAAAATTSAKAGIGTGADACLPCRRRSDAGRPASRAWRDRAGLPAPRARALAWAAALACGLGLGPAARAQIAAGTLPVGGQVLAGQAQFVGQGRQLTVSTGERTVIQWQQFSIGADASVRFDQPSAGSSVLNRVVGNDPSQVLGQLSSNGQVWLLNPRGVLFGTSARVDVAALVASTLDLPDADWLAGRWQLDGGLDPARGALVNQGRLRTPLGGQVLLLGGAAGVRNEGLIEAPGGQVALAAGARIELVDSAVPRLSVAVTAPAGEVLNLGQVLAGGGRIDLQAALVNQQGVLRADALNAAEDGGQIRLSASSRLQTGADSLTTADGARGGALRLDAGADGEAALSGRLQALGTRGVGGTAQVQGARLGLLDGLTLDLSGQGGGGQGWIGGGLHGDASVLRLSEAVHLAPGATLRADALGAGDGGTLVLFGRQSARIHGQLSAQALGERGDGGLIETSGGWLDVRPLSLSAASRGGRAGRWLLDPADVVITSGAVDSAIGSGPDFSPGVATAVLSTDTLAAALDAGNDVTVTTSGAFGGNGDIRVVNATLRVAPPTPVRLTLQADRNITVDFSTLRSDGAALTLDLQASAGALGTAIDGLGYGGGAIAVRSSTLLTAGGDLLLGGPSQSLCGPSACTTVTGAIASDDTGALRNGVLVSASTLDAGSGLIRLEGHSVVQASETAGVSVTEGSRLVASRIVARGRVDSDGDAGRTGVKLAGQLVASTGLDAEGSVVSGVYSLVSPPVGVDVTGQLQVGAGSGGDGQLRLVGRVVEAAPGDGQGSAQAAAVVGDVSGAAVGLPRVGVALRGGNAALQLQGGVSATLDGAVSGGSGQDWGVYVSGAAGTLVDAAGGSALQLLAEGGRLFLSGSLVAPTGGTLELRAGDRLEIDAATISGRPSVAGLWADGDLLIGRSGQSTTLDFSLAGAVQLRAGGRLTLGALDLAALEAGGVAAAGAGTDRQPQAVSDAPAVATRLIGGTGTLHLLADAVHIGTGATIHVDATGDALVLRGSGSEGTLSAFSNASGASAFSTPAGRWLVYAAAPDGVADAFSGGGLVPAFRQYGSRWSEGQGGLAATGHGLIFGVTPVLGLTTGYSRDYDGTVATGLGSGAVSGLLGGDRLGAAPVFADASAGTDKALRLTDPVLVDVNGRPVHGYTTGSGFVGTVTPRLLTVSGAGVLDKVYDGTTAATTAAAIGLEGVIGGDAVRLVVGGASFASADAGEARGATLTGLSLDGTAASNYRLAGSSLGTTGRITPRPLSLQAGIADKVYDGTTTAQAADLRLTGVIEGDGVSASAVQARFDDASAGSDKLVRFEGLSLSGAAAGNYTLDSASTARGTITPRPLAVAGLSADDKVYDGTLAAQARFSLSGVLEGDEVRGVVARARFDSAGVGQDKTVTLSGFGLAGAQAGNYVLVLGQGQAETFGASRARALALDTLETRASITPAVLRYVADPAASRLGLPLSGLEGRVEGFVAGESLSSATSGTLQFSLVGGEGQDPTRVPGRYAVQGSGLSAANYVFVQDAGNATAYTVRVLDASTPVEALGAGLGAQALDGFPVAVATSATRGRTLDLAPAVEPGGAGQAPAFAALSLTSLSPEGVAAILAARERYKKTVFGEALARLELDPGLAAAPACTSLRQAADGRCLVLTPLEEGQGQRPVLAFEDPPVPPAAAVGGRPVPAGTPGSDRPSAPAVAAAGATAVDPAMAASATPSTATSTPRVGAAGAGSAASVAATAAALPAATQAMVERLLRLPPRRPVQQAALPQIQRKLALLVGIDAYQDPRIPRLQNAVADARAVARVLEQQLGYETVVLENPGRRELFLALNQLALESGAADSVVLYYAGHGERAEKSGEGYWQPADADPQRPETWLSNADLGLLMRAMPARQQVLISDSCFSGALVGDERIRPATGVDVGSLLGRRSAVVMSSGGNEPVFDSGRDGHSPFAWNLMQALGKVDAWRPGSTVFEQVRFAVARELPQRPQYGASRAAGHEAGGDYLFEQRRLAAGVR